MLKAILILSGVIFLLGVIVYLLIVKIRKQRESMNDLYQENNRLQSQLDRVTLENKIKTEVENNAKQKKNQIRTTSSNADKFADSLNVLRDNKS